MAPVARLCSRNEGKLRELRAALPGWTIEPLDADAYPPEAGATYRDNARTKAVFGRSVGPTETWMLGEDSGLEVEGLGWEPGVRSARFGGDDPVTRLLDALRGVPERRARYVCELVAISPTGTEVYATGVLEGTIAEEPRGDEGFGYDPIFVPEREVRTVAELGNDWKRSNSHRARAARALRDSVSG